jgi:DNA-binding NarL/FixJ family response regulator
MRSQLIDGLVKNPAPLSQSPLEKLSDRELEVFRLLGEGLRTREIASQLHLSIKTVETYYERIKLRLNVQNLQDLSRQATLWVHGQDANSPLSNEQSL